MGELHKKLNHCKGAAAGSSWGHSAATSDTGSPLKPEEVVTRHQEPSSRSERWHSRRRPMPVRRQLFAFDKLIPKSARRIPRRLRCRASTKNLATGIADFGFVCARPQLDLFKQGSVSAPRSDLSTHCEVSTSAARESCPAGAAQLLRAQAHQSHAEWCSSPLNGRQTKQN